MPRSEREATVWRIVRAIYLRIAGHYTGRDLSNRPSPEQEAVLESWHEAIERDTERLAAVMDAARAAGIATVHSRLHVAENLDHELLDEAIASAREDDDA